MRLEDIYRCRIMKSFHKASPQIDITMAISIAFRSSNNLFVYNPLSIPQSPHSLPEPPATYPFTSPTGCHEEQEQEHSIPQIPRPPLPSPPQSLAFSLTLPTLNFAAYFFNTLSL